MKKMLFISAVAAAMLFSGCGSSGGSSDATGDVTPITGDTTPATGDTTPATGDTTPATGDTTPATGAGTTDPANGNAIKDGLHDDGTSNRPADVVVSVATRDWLVIQTTELADSNTTSSFSEAFFPKREWIEADYFCKNYKDDAFPNATWALPTQTELLSIMLPLVTDIRMFDESTPQFVVDAKVLPSAGTLDAFKGAIFFNVENKSVSLGNGAIGSALISYTTVDMGVAEEAFFTCIKQ